MSQLSRFVGALLMAALCSAVAAHAQWDPANGQWGKTEPTDLRVMTYNVKDHLRTNQPKIVGTAQAWDALARTVAAMKPDVLIVQEAGDTGSGADSVADLTTVLDLFVHGGTDPFLGGQVTSYVQLYAPDCELPYIFVSNITDGYNRNVMLSRYPFADLNGDGVATRGDIHIILPDLYATHLNGGIRGFMFAEIDLPDAVYAGDFVMGNAHLKAYSNQGDHDDRVAAAQDVAYYIHYFFNGAGTGTPDPRNKIQDSPPAQTVLDDNTPVVIGGDWNEDEGVLWPKGPAGWLTQAEFAGGTDGTDRDLTDMTWDSATNPYDGSRGTYGTGTSKLDYIAWQDSIATLRRQFIFKSDKLGSNTAWLPPELVGFIPSPFLVSSVAADHRPVVVDLVLPLAAPPLLGDANCDETVDVFDINPFVMAILDPAAYAGTYGCDDLCDVNGDGVVDVFDINPFVELLLTQ